MTDHYIVGRTKDNVGWMVMEAQTIDGREVFIEFVAVSSSARAIEIADALNRPDEAPEPQTVRTEPLYGGFLVGHCQHRFPDGTRCLLSPDAHREIPGLAVVHGFPLEGSSDGNSCDLPEGPR